MKAAGFDGGADWEPDVHNAHTEAIGAAVEAAVKAERARILSEIGARVMLIESSMFKCGGDVSCELSWAHGVDDTIGSIKRLMTKLGGP